ncbi:MAG: glycosyltransferase [Wolinella succinogenes]|uniref:glycosyltransferase family 2 protein n=1 Tax=Wolinella succinogenes TaxID=844 RepID=UPI0016A07A77|nr:glycosyltransferase family 2 protein [Wolinella succinogenes]NLU34695.1 glycosyltransferase [Wolinella succinogenes]
MADYPKNGIETTSRLFTFSDKDDHRLEGGRRKKKHLKKPDKSTPLVSVITVVFNGEKDLEETIQSVVGQTYDNLEYIIIDGGSSDGTLDIIKKYEDSIDYWVSEKDRGIYDAMNKGVGLSAGKWVNFMNSGDYFYTPNAVLNIFSKIAPEGVDVVYGDHEIRYSSLKSKVVWASKDLSLIWKGMIFSHQSTFVDRGILKKYRFNIFNKIAADYELFYNLSLNKSRFYHVPIIVASVAAGGISDIKRVDSIVACWNVVEKTSWVNLYYIRRVIREMIRVIVINFLSLNGK